MRWKIKYEHIFAEVNRNLSIFKSFFLEKVSRKRDLSSRKEKESLIDNSAQRLPDGDIWKLVYLFLCIEKYKAWHYRGQYWIFKYLKCSSSTQGIVLSLYSLSWTFLKDSGISYLNNRILNGLLNGFLVLLKEQEIKRSKVSRYGIPSSFFQNLSRSNHKITNLIFMGK